MVQGTASSVGKSLIAAALCRIFARTGARVLPFKSQNMSNNAAALADGTEIGRAQYLQAIAARAEPKVEMNPILLKPESDSRSQVVLMGKPYGKLGGKEYGRRNQLFWDTAVRAYKTLAAQADLIVIEGAGSPAEINLASSDIVNMAVARLAGAPVILVADIDPGGVFAQVVGTLALLGEEDRKLVRGIVINKFRGDLSLLEPGLAMLEKLTGIPVLGVVPMLSGLALPDEDGAALRVAPQGGFSRGSGPGLATGLEPASGPVPEPGPRIDIAVIKLPHIANFDDFDALAAEPAVNLRFVEDPMLLGRPDALILPGTKSTLADLAWLKDSGFGDGIRWLSRIGTSIVGICGGFQMLGERIDDPDGAEGKGGTMAGLGLLPAHTVFGSGKKVLPRVGRTAPSLGGSLASLAGIAIAGYEIHSGETNVEGPAFALLDADDRGAPPSPDGSWSADGRIWGSYLHGIFGSDEFRKAWLATFGVSARSERTSAALDRSIDALADAVASSLDMKKLYDLIGLENMIIPEQGEQ